MILLRPLLLCLLCATPIAAETEMDVATAARAASAQLEQASLLLSEAMTSDDRIDALTETIRAYEQGLTALRAGLRQVTIRERALAQTFEAQRDHIARLLGVLQTMGNAPAPLLLLHPSGPIGTARSGMMIAEITPALQAEAETLRFDLETLTLLRQLQETAVGDLQTGMEGVQAARLALSTALSERTTLPRRFVNNAGQMQRLLETSETLDSFASGLGELPEASVVPLAVVPGNLALPATGTILRRFNQTDAAGIKRPGIVLATPPGTLVTAPTDATIRYAGPLLDYAKVIILEPTQGTLHIFAGLDAVYGSPGEIVSPGTPLGLMGGSAPISEDFLLEAAQGGGTDRSETLYIEVREAGRPVDPTKWFATQ